MQVSSFWQNEENTNRSDMLLSMAFIPTFPEDKENIYPVPQNLCQLWGKDYKLRTELNIKSSQNSHQVAPLESRLHSYLHPRKTKLSVKKIKLISLLDNLGSQIDQFAKYLNQEEIFQHVESPDQLEKEVHKIQQRVLKDIQVSKFKTPNWKDDSHKVTKRNAKVNLSSTPI